MAVDERILKIKKDLRLDMNGVASAGMRNGGISYGLNFGVGLPRLRQIAGDIGFDASLALSLWKENVRECRIIAALVYPPAEFLPDLADEWVSQIQSSDLADVCSMYLFSRMKDASATAFRWMASDNEMVQYCGFLSLAHMMRSGREMSPRYICELKDQAEAVLAGEGALPKLAARTALDCLERNDGQK